MKLTFEKIRIVPEKSSYLIDSNYLDVRVGMDTQNLNMVSNVINLPWILRDHLGNIHQRGNVDVNIGYFTSKIELRNLEINNLYIFEITNPDYYESVATIFYGDITNFEIIDEDFVFPVGTVKIFGDILFDRELRKIRFFYDWNVLRSVGNGVIFYDNRFFLYCPKIIFTSKTNVPESIQFVPFPGLNSRTILIYVIPRIKKTGEYTYSIDPPTRINLVFEYKRHTIENNVLAFREFQSPREILLPNKISVLNVLDYDNRFTNFYLESVF